MIRDPRRLAPSRFYFALSRLVAYLLVRRCGAASPDPDRLLAFDPKQNPIEANVISVICYLMPALAGWALIPTTWHLGTRTATAMAVAAAPVIFWNLAALAVGAALLPLYRLGRIGPVEAGRIQARVLIGVLTLLSLAVALWGRWARAAGWLWLGLVAINGIAALILLVVRRRVAEVNRRLEAP